MRIGLIARAENSGLGIQTWEFARHMQPAKTLIIRPHSDRGFYPQRFDEDASIVQGLPGTRHLHEFVDGLDVIFTCETPYNYELFSIAAAAGVASVLQFNFEFLDYLARPRLPRPDLLAAPSPWHLDDVPGDKRMLPVPIATDRFTPALRSGPARRFLHIAGRPAIHDRNGTADLLAALPMVRTPITVIIRCQDPDYVPRLLAGGVRIPAHITLEVVGADTENYWDNYRDADVLVMPRRFGGLCLPVQEALAAGMPVIMPAISPNLWLPQSWLVPATLAGRFMARSMIGIYSADPERLAMKIDEFATIPAFYVASQRQAVRLATERSWANLKPVYDRTFAELVAA
ncbi:glycosyltransferase [Nocardia otitidiscaviarum]|uniref:glycosyltransferase n=1 Tax=Nocardia otitidiscaviarum TaxID=1823 RepID=UPI0004A70536|nr:glycosyltransferase [Nocardia otitidiscaviarum]